MAEHQCPPDHKHGATTTCNKNHGCRCDECKAAEIIRHTDNQRKRRRAKLYGRYVARVPALSTHRRIQGLQYLGWTFAHIGAISGVSYGAVANLMRRNTVEPGTRDNIAEAFRVLIAQGQGPSEVTRRRAATKGYVSPLAWDDLEDPDATPADVRNPERGKFDPIAVDLAVSGQHVPLNYREREAVITELNKRRWADPRIGRHIGYDTNTVGRIRRRLQLPAWDYHTRAADYTADERMNP